MRYFLISVTLLIALKIQAQNLLTPAWYKALSSTEQVFGWGVAHAAPGQILWTPSIKTPDWPHLQLEMWRFSETGISAGPMYAVRSDSELQAYTTAYENEGYYAAGRACSGLVNSCDQYIVKIDPATGLKRWDRYLDSGGNYDEFDGLVVRPGDGIYLGGWAGETGAGIYDTDLSLRKLDPNGNPVWSKKYGISTTAEHQDGQFVVDDNYLFAAGLWGGDGIANLHEGKAFLGKFSKNDGTMIDSVQFGSTGFWLNWNNVWGMCSDGQKLYLTGVGTPAAGDNQIFVACFSKDLQPQWLRYWGDAGTETARAIAVLNGRVYVGGTSNSPGISLGGAYDAVLLVLDAATGDLRAARVWGDASDNEFRDLIASPDALFISGTSGVNLFSSTSPTDMEAFLLRVDLAGISETGNPQTDPLNVSITPNPAEGQCILRFSGFSGETEIRICDLLGHCLKTSKVLLPAGDNAFQLDLNGLPAGELMVIIRNDTTIATQKLLKF